MRPLIFGDQIFFVTIQHTPTIGWQPKGVGHVQSFWEKTIHLAFYLLGD
jgi:hypothetical protein